VVVRCFEFGLKNKMHEKFYLVFFKFKIEIAPLLCVGSAKINPSKRRTKIEDRRHSGTGEEKIECGMEAEGEAWSGAVVGREERPRGLW